jgi:hypothetical protein
MEIVIFSSFLEVRSHSCHVQVYLDIFFGRYLNDDGETLDTDGLQNVYTFKYAQASAEEDIQIDLNMTRMATNLQKGRENDDFHIN